MTDRKGFPQKAYDNSEFLRSKDARAIRVLCELEEPKARFESQSVEDTLVFFGSARILSPEDARENLENLQKSEVLSGDEKIMAIQLAEHKVKLSRYYDDAAQIAQQLSTWTKSLNREERFVICSGGGPGIMEAANLGAQRAGCRSIGLNISIPYEQMPNPYISQELGFTFHYFFVRKYWFLHKAKGIFVFPGGFGTMDEFFELLTLLQTQKSTRKMAIVLYGKEYWSDVLNFDAFVKWGTISQNDLNLFKLVDDVDTAVEYAKEILIQHHL
ncbi:MAG: LOG family protein [Deferribacteres bacterium]|nr:LOG family protein [candidate division KSB1 bacterium]MCB9502363.1 LOG family protein [Deferribacteres bacterium]